MDTLLLEKNKHYIFKDTIYSDFLNNVSYIQHDMPDIDNILIIIPNCDKLAVIIIACILLNKKIYYVDPLKPQNIRHIDKFEILYTTQHFYDHNKKNIDRLCKTIKIIDKIKYGEKYKLQNNYKELDINVVDNNNIININYNILKSQFNIFKRKLKSKKYIFMYNLMDIDILPIFFYSILYKKTILFYKENQQKSNRGYYITRDTDNIRSNKKLVLYHKKQRIVNNKSKDYLIFDTNRYIDIQYNNNQFIYKKYLKGFSENNGLWIKNIDTPINRQL